MTPSRMTCEQIDLLRKRYMRHGSSAILTQELLALCDMARRAIDQDEKLVVLREEVAAIERRLNNQYTAGKMA